MEKKTQNELILKHLKEYGGITSLEAIQEYGITRLSARIYDLRKEGYSISADKKKVLVLFVEEEFGDMIEMLVILLEL